VSTVRRRVSTVRRLIIIVTIAIINVVNLQKLAIEVETAPDPSRARLDGEGEVTRLDEGRGFVGGGGGASVSSSL
jgi:hypothetical protein